MSKRQFRTVSVIAWVVAAVAMAPRAAADLADVYLKNGLTLRGDVSLTDTEVILRNAAGQVRLSRAEVDRIVPVPTLASQPATTPTTLPAPAAATPPGSQTPVAAGGLGAEAGGAGPGAAELPPPPPLSDADIQRLRLGELRLDGPAEVVRVRFLRKARQRDLPLEVLDVLRRRADFRPAWEDVLTRGLPHEKLQLIIRLTGTEHAERIAVDSDPAVFDAFRRRVLPLVNRGCARSGCHGGKGAREFRFPVGSSSSDTYAYTAFVLLDQMQTAYGPLVNRANPEESVLLTYMLPPETTDRGHPPVGRGPAFKPVVRGRDDRLYAAVLDWIDQLAVPRPDYGLVYENPYPGRRSYVATAPSDAASSPATQPTTAPAHSPGVPPPETSP